MTPRRKRFALAGGVLVAVAVVVGLILNAFRSNLVFFYSPSQVAQHEAPAGRAFRIGGMVEPGTLKRDGTDIRFVVTDTAKSVPVHYVGILPDLFKEGKGVVAQGRLEGGEFVAQRDPREARRELRAAGSGRRDEARAAGPRPEARGVAGAVAERAGHPAEAGELMHDHRNGTVIPAKAGTRFSLPGSPVSVHSTNEEPTMSPER